MNQEPLLFSGKNNDIKIIEVNEIKKVLVGRCTYMKWDINDIASQRMAIVQLYKTGLGTQESLAQLFSIHVNSIQKYISAYTKYGLIGLASQPSGPKEKWKLTPQLRAKILIIALKEGIIKYEAIQKTLKTIWNEDVSLPTIRQLLLENGFENKKNNTLSENLNQMKLFNNIDIDTDTEQLYLKFNCQTESNDVDFKEENNIMTDKLENTIETDIHLNNEIKARRYYSPAQRIYLAQLEQGGYCTYAGGLLFAPLIMHYSFFSTIKRVVKIKTYEGYSLEELCLTLLYFDVFNYRSLEDFKRVYSEEFGILLGQSQSPSLFTLRRFLHKVRKLKISEELIDEFALEYLNSGIAEWGVLYIDGHFLPYYGMYPITKGWHGVLQKAMKGSYNFIGVDKKFNPWIFLIRSSSEDLLEKIPEIIEKLKKIGKRAGISQEQMDNLIVLFDREGYSAGLYRYLEGKDREPKKRRAIFISWAKYSDKWVYKIEEEKFNKIAEVTYEIKKSKKTKYYETERIMRKYGKIRTIVIQRKKDKKRIAIHTNATNKEIPSSTIVQLMCRRWGEENLIKELLLKHLINYSPGYFTESMDEQPLVDNPEKKKLKKEKAKSTSELNKLKISFTEEVLKKRVEKSDKKKKKIEKSQSLLLSDISTIDNKILLMKLKIDKLPEKIRFNEAHNGKKLVQLNYEKKRFLDCIKIFTYNIEKKMCELILNYYDNRKEVLSVLSMIIKRGGYIKLKNGKLKVQLRRFQNKEIDYIARRLCEDLNQMEPVTLDKYCLPMHFEVL